MIVLQIGRQAAYNLLPEKKEDTCYYCIDTEKFYRGSQLVDQKVQIVAARSLLPYQGVLYVVDGTVEKYDGVEWETVGEAYRLDTEEVYLYDDYMDDLDSIASEAAIYTDTSSRYAANSRNSSTSNQEDSEYTISGIYNMTGIENSDKVVIVNSLEDIESPTEGMGAELYDPLSDSSILYTYIDGNWEELTETVNLNSYYRDIDYVAMPLNVNMTLGTATRLTASALSIEDENAINYTEFSQISGAADAGIIDDSSSDYDTDTATINFVTTAISAATQHLQEYVSTLTGEFDPAGSADLALENAVSYVDERLTWHRSG